MARTGRLEKNPLQTNKTDHPLVIAFKHRLIDAMNLAETSQNAETPLVIGALPPEILDASERRRIDAVATIMALEAVIILESLLSEKKLPARTRDAKDLLGIE